MNASPMPGSVAWLSASPISARLRSSMNAPIVPAASPSSVVPMTTTRVL